MGQVKPGRGTMWLALAWLVVMVASFAAFFIYARNGLAP
jgi:hypothetical protein